MQFADLHDTPGRMLAKNVIKEIIPLETARKFFHDRLITRLREEAERVKMAEVLLGRPLSLYERPAEIVSLKTVRDILERTRNSVFASEE